MSALSQSELERRKPVWRAMADLCRDTEYTEADIAFLVRAIRAAGYTAEEAETILRAEVLPAFGVNLLSVAGEWAGWPDETVDQVVLDQLQKKPNPFDKAVLLAIWPLVKDDWARVKAALEA